MTAFKAALLATVAVVANKDAKPEDVTGLDKFDDLWKKDSFIRLHGAIEEKIDFKKCPRSYHEVQLDQASLNKVNTDLVKGGKEKVMFPGSETQLAFKRIRAECGLPDKDMANPTRSGCVWAFLTVPSKLKKQFGIRGSVQEYLRSCLVFHNESEKPEFRIIHESHGTSQNYFATYLEGNSDGEYKDWTEVHPYQLNPMLQTVKDARTDRQKLKTMQGKLLYKDSFKQDADLCRLDKDGGKSDDADTYRPIQRHPQPSKRSAKQPQAGASNGAPKAKGKKAVATLCFDTHYLPEKLRKKNTALPLECKQLEAKELPKHFFDKTVSTEAVKEHLVKNLCKNAGKNGSFRKEVCPGADNVDMDDWVLSDDKRDSAVGHTDLDRCPVPTFLDINDRRDSDVAGGEDMGDTWRLTLFQREPTNIVFHKSINQPHFVSMHLPVGSIAQATVTVAQHILSQQRSPVHGLPARDVKGWIANVVEAPFLYGFTALKEVDPLKAWDKLKHQDEWSNVSHAYLGHFKGKWADIEPSYSATGADVQGLYFGATGFKRSGTDMPSDGFSKSLINAESQFGGGNMAGNSVNAQQLAVMRQKFAAEAKALNICVPQQPDQSSTPGQYLQPVAQAAQQFRKDGGWGF